MTVLINNQAAGQNTISYAKDKFIARVEAMTEELGEERVQEVLSMIDDVIDDLDPDSDDQWITQDHIDAIYNFFSADKIREMVEPILNLRFRMNPATGEPIGYDGVSYYDGSENFYFVDQGDGIERWKYQLGDGNYGEPTTRRPRRAFIEFTE